MTKEARGSFRSGQKMSRKEEGTYNTEVDAPAIDTDEVSGTIYTKDEKEKANETYVPIRPQEESDEHRSKNN